MHMSVRAWAAFAALSVIWGMPYLLIKIALGGVAPLAVAWWELTIGAAVLLPLAALRGELSNLRPHWRAIVALTLFQLAVPSVLMAVSQQWIRSSLAGVLAATAPLLIVLLGPLFGAREPFNARRTAALLVGFLGVAVLLGFDAPRGNAEWLGVSCMLLAALAYAIAPLVIQHYLHRAEGLGASAVSLALASLVLLPVSVWFFPSSLPSARAIASLIALGAVCTASGLLLYFFLIKEAGASRASVVKYINPLVAALLGAVALGEAFPLSSVVGMTLVLGGSWFATRDANTRITPAKGEPK
jgi:drug/metabolite transporter (DMT)-like permease